MSQIPVRVNRVALLMRFFFFLFVGGTTHLCALSVYTHYHKLNVSFSNISFKTEKQRKSKANLLSKGLPCA